MPASKSSRARQARAQRNGAQRNAANARNGVAVKTVPAASRGASSVAVRNGAAAGRRVAASEPQAALEAPETGTIPAWMQIVTFVVSLAGLGVSVYLTIAHYNQSTLLGCSDSGLVNCAKVTTSPQSYVFGIPVAVLGLAFYVFAVAIMSPWAWRSRWRPREIALVRLASVVAGIGFVIYLIYAELLVIGSICLYCTSVHVLTFILFGLIAFAAAAWGLPERQRP